MRGINLCPQKFKGVRLSLYVCYDETHVWMLFLDFNTIIPQRLVEKPGTLVNSTRFLGVHITDNPLNHIFAL